MNSSTPQLMETGARPDRRTSSSSGAAAVPVRPKRPRRILWDLLMGAGVMVALHLFVVQISVVKGHSMEPSLADGDRLVVDRLAYNLMSVGRGDVVVLRYPLDPAVDFVKRVIGLPGDRIRMDSGHVYVNDRLVDDCADAVLDCENMAELEVPERHYFVLGDNRPISCDSREFGLVAEDLLKGKVRARFWPLSRMAIF